MESTLSELQKFHFGLAKLLLIRPTMWPIAIICSLILYFSPKIENNYLNYTSEKLHFLCLKNVPHHKFSYMTQAVVCGSDKKIPNFQKDLLKKSGLIHLIVVSASHLVFIEYFLSRIKIPLLLRFLCIFLYTLTTLLQPPAVRSFIAILLAPISLRLHWIPFETTLISILLLFIWKPQNILSYSALLSALASLANASKSSHLKKNVLIYIILLPVIIHLSAPHPASILLNILFAPIIGFLLFPLSILSFFFSPLAFSLDYFWNTLFWILNSLHLKSYSQTESISQFYLWAYVFMTNCFLILKEKYEIHYSIYNSEPQPRF